MPDNEFIKRKRGLRHEQQTKWLCRTGAHRVARTMIAIQYGTRVGLCGNCIAKRCDRKPDGRLNVATYWVRDWPTNREQIAQL